MKQADLIIGAVYANGSRYFGDYHTVKENKPILDQKQDWVLHAASESRTHTFLSFSRAFDTCDQNDIPCPKRFTLATYLNCSDMKYVKQIKNRPEHLVELLEQE